VLHQIGIGTLGPVFRTYEPTRDRLVAVKVFRLDIIPEQAHVLADALSRATQSSLLHPSIVEPIAAGVEGTLAYRAEEYVAAESLDVAMRHYAPASVEKALPFITQLAGAIDFARAAGVGHGGLHPRDIFVTPDEARATGFGVVEALEEVGIRAPIRRPYTAPERIDGGAWGTPADVFSLAAITYELLTGRRPAGTGAQAGTLPEGERNDALHAVLARAMDDDPSVRYPSALAFAGALESAANGEPESSAVSDVAAIALPVSAPLAIPVAHDSNPASNPGVAQGLSPASTPGEFEIEAALDPVHKALEDVAIEPTLFDDESTPEPEAVADEVRANHAGPERFADDFVEDVQEEEPAVASGDHLAQESVYAAEEPMFAASEPEPDPHDVQERSGPAILPIALGVVLGLLGGFAAGYFVGSRDRLAPAAEPAPVTAAPPAAAPTGPATKEKPGQYSEEKVTAPVPTVAQAAAGAAAAAPAPAPVPAPVPAPPTAPAARETLAKTGHLVVTSTPSRAAVTVNGKWRGRTPLTLDALPFGEYVVRVVQTGFRVAREDVTLSARDASHTINARLERSARAGVPATPTSRGASPAAYTGSLYVDSRPRGATVLVDGRKVGETPLRLADVAIGSHVVKIEMAGKKAWTSTARVTAGKMERVTGSLEEK
jgi:protein kinase-like protein/PEGA domain-containing protein